MTVRPAKIQISLGIRSVWSESSLCAQWVAKDPIFLHADSEDSDQTGRMPRLIWVFAGRTCHVVGFVMRRLISTPATVCRVDGNYQNANCPFRCKTSHWAASSEFVSSSIPSWQILTAHAQPFRGARDLAFCLKVPLDSLLVWASSGGSGETARMHRLVWTFAARIGDKY